MDIVQTLRIAGTLASLIGTAMVSTGTIIEVSKSGAETKPEENTQTENKES